MRDKKKLDRRREILGRLGLGIRPGMLIVRPDGYYRMRRGKLVRIPDEWVGRPVEMCEKFPGLSSKRWRAYKLKQNRQSKNETRKLRMRGHKGWGRVPRDRRGPKDDRGLHEPRSPQLGHPNNLTPRHRGKKWQQRLDREDGIR